MHPIAFMLAACTLSIDVGWQPLENGELEYIIQIEPQMLETLKAGQDVVSDIPPYLKTIRSYRITIGNGPLPRRLGVVPRAAVPSTNAPTAADPSRLATIAGRPPLKVPDEPTLADPAPSLPPDEPLPAVAEPPADPLVNPSQPFVESTPEPSTDVPDTEAASVETPAVEETFSLPGEPLPFPVEITAPAEQPAAHVEPAAASTATGQADHGQKPTKADPVAPKEEKTEQGEAKAPTNEPKPWWPLTATLLGLFFSIGGNVYMGWSMLGLRAKYREVLERFHGPSGQSDSRRERSAS